MRKGTGVFGLDLYFVLANHNGISLQYYLRLSRIVPAPAIEMRYDDTPEWLRLAG